MGTSRRQALAALAVAALAGTSSPATAQSEPPYPNKPVRMLIGFSAGSSTDAVARVIAQGLTNALGQPVIVENRPGVGGNLAADLVAKSPADGYTLLFCNSGLAISAALYPKLPFDPLKDLAPVTQVTSMPHVLVATPSLPANSVQELVALAKANPGKYNFASAGAGNSDHMAGALFNVLAGTDLVHVPYRGGPQAMADTISGNVAVYFSGLPGALPMIKAERVKALGVSSPTSSASLPTVPAIADTVPGFEVNLWYGLVAPAGTPAPLVERLAAEVAKVLNQADTQEKLAKMGVDRAGTAPAQFKALIESEAGKWARVVKSTGITVN